MHTHTRTYAILAVSASAFDEIKSKLEAAGYTDQFHHDRSDGLVIDCHGIALSRAVTPDPVPQSVVRDKTEAEPRGMDYAVLVAEHDELTKTVDTHHVDCLCMNCQRFADIAGEIGRRQNL